METCAQLHLAIGMLYPACFPNCVLGGKLKTYVFIAVTWIVIYSCYQQLNQIFSSIQTAGGTPSNEILE